MPGYDTPTPYLMKQSFLICNHCHKEIWQTDSFVDMSRVEKKFKTRLYHHGECFDVIAERLYTLTRRKNHA